MKLFYRMMLIHLGKGLPGLLGAVYGKLLYPQSKHYMGFYDFVIQENVYRFTFVHVHFDNSEAIKHIL